MVGANIREVGASRTVRMRKKKELRITPRLGDCVGLVATMSIKQAAGSGLGRGTR